MRMLAALVALVLTAAASLAQSYPNKSVRVVVGFAAGGPTDVIAPHRGAEALRNARPAVLCREHRRRRRQHRLGRRSRARRADGYTVMVISTGFMVNPSLYAKVPYDPIKDFAPVTLVAHSPNVVVVNPSVPAKTIPELVQLIRDNPGKYSFAGPGVGSTPHLSGELFRLHSISIWCTCRSPAPGPAIQATLGGHTPIAFTAMPPAIAAVKDGKLRALGVAAQERVAALPDLPTFAEQGIKDQEADTLTGIVVPAGTPKEIVDLLQREIAKIVAQPDVKEKLAALGFVPIANTPEEFGARIKARDREMGQGGARREAEDRVAARRHSAASAMTAEVRQRRAFVTKMNSLSGIISTR